MSLIFAVLLASVPIDKAIPCPNPTHYDGDDIRCDSDLWRDLAGRGGMRLGKVDAPEMRCSRKNKRKPCQKAEAVASRDHLRALTSDQYVTCQWTGERTSAQTGSRPVVMCRTEAAGDLSCSQWRSGHARYSPYFDPKKRFKRRCRP